MSETSTQKFNAILSKYRNDVKLWERAVAPGKTNICHTITMEVEDLKSLLDTAMSDPSLSTVKDRLESMLKITNLMVGMCQLQYGNSSKMLIDYKNTDEEKKQVAEKAERYFAKAKELGVTAETLEDAKKDIRNAFSACYGDDSEVLCGELKELTTPSASVVPEAVQAGGARQVVCKYMAFLRY
jgi:hypothetical protein